MARYVNIENKENIVEAIHNLLSDCNLKHKNNCLAADCKECIGRFFERQNTHLLPTADVVEVTRCSNCKYIKTFTCPITGTKTLFCDYGEKPAQVAAEHYCGYGERKDM